MIAINGFPALEIPVSKRNWHGRERRQKAPIQNWMGAFLEVVATTLCVVCGLRLSGTTGRWKASYHC